MNDWIYSNDKVEIVDFLSIKKRTNLTYFNITLSHTIFLCLVVGGTVVVV